MNESEIWPDGTFAVVYSQDIAAMREIAAWRPVRECGTKFMAEYHDRQGTLFALQIRLPARLRNRAARKLQLPEQRLRTLSDTDRAKRTARLPDRA